MFPAEAKTKAEKMIKNIFIAFENRINNLAWMSPETKVSAVENYTCQKLKLDILTNGRLFSLSN
jgi:endothelin-converting enzyme/putative endopeptidase